MGDTEIIILAAVAIAAVVGAIVMILFSTRSDASARSNGKAEQEIEKESRDEELECDGEENSDDIDDEDTEDADEAEENDEPVVEAYEAKVVSKRVESLVNGKNVSLRSVEFWVVFETAEGEKKEFSVSHEYFDTVNEGDEGTLVIVGGRLFDFGAGEEITEEPEAEAEDAEVTE